MNGIDRTGEEKSMRLKRWFSMMTSDDAFLAQIKKAERFLAKTLSLAMILVIIIAVIDLGVVLSKEVLVEPDGFLATTLIKIFGLFLNVLIALEILENLTAYLKRNVFHVELVLVTAMTAVARKVIILDFAKVEGGELIGLAIAIFALAVSYWIIRLSKPYEEH
jgi:uncharacterized membrane protein (DUF373 family)